MRLVMKCLQAALAASVLALAACGSNMTTESPPSGGSSAARAATVHDAASTTPAASPNGTAIPAATQIIDGAGNVWTVAEGVVYENGALAGVSLNVTLLLYDNNNLYQENSASNWYSWSGSGWIPDSDPRATPSPNGTTVVAANLTGTGTGTGTDIVSVSSGQCATVNAYSTTAGTPIVQWPCGGVSEQVWTFAPIGSYYHIVSVGSGQCLNISNGSTAQGDAIIQWPCQTNGATNDQWSIVAVGGAYEIVSAFDGQCLIVAGDSQADSATLIQDPCATDQTNGLWNLAAPSAAAPSDQVQITDGSGNVWAVVGGVIYENGVEAGYSLNVTLLLYDNNTLYQQNSAGTWYSWNGSTWLASNDPRATPSPNGTAVPATTQITDSSGNIWAIAAGVAYENGALAGISANVTELFYENGSIYQENSAGSWYSWNGSTWIPSNAPAALGSATLSWNAPTQNTDGTPLTDLAGYTIYYGSSPNALIQNIQVSNAGATSYVVSNLSSGTYFFTVAANASDGTQSAQSSVGSKTIP